jgi:hypothetical protein
LRQFHQRQHQSAALAKQALHVLLGMIAAHLLEIVTGAKSLACACDHQHIHAGD